MNIIKTLLKDLPTLLVKLKLVLFAQDLEKREKILRL